MREGATMADIASLSEKPKADGPKYEQAKREGPPRPGIA